MMTPLETYLQQRIGKTLTHRTGTTTTTATIVSVTPPTVTLMVSTFTPSSSPNKTEQTVHGEVTIPINDAKRMNEFWTQVQEAIP